MKKKGVNPVAKEHEIVKLKKEIEDITLHKKTVLMSDPNAIADGVTETFNETQKRILKVASLDKQLTPKQRFDFFYQELLERTDKLAAAIPSIGTDYWGQVADKLQDLTTTLSDEEQEFYENYATLRKLGSLYAINEGGYSEESAGFWDSFMNRLLALFFPKTSVLSSSFGVKGTDKAVAINHAFERLQIKDVDLIRSEIVDEVKERMTPPWWGTENDSSLVGN
jgi:hypothetical protein